MNSLYVALTASPAVIYGVEYLHLWWRARYPYNSYGQVAKGQRLAEKVLRRDRGEEIDSKCCRACIQCGYCVCARVGERSLRGCDDVRDALGRAKERVCLPVDLSEDRPA